MISMNLPKLPTISRISSRITRILGANPGPYTLQGTNSYLIGRGKERFLIDTSSPSKPEYIETLRREIEDKGLSISNILITHWHEDHFGAIPDVQEMCLKLQKERPVFHKLPGGPIPSWAQQGGDGAKLLETIKELKDNQVFKVDADTTLRILHTPGHTVDHVSLWLEEERILFPGDMILGHGSAVFESLYDYMSSLQRVHDLSPPWAMILSAHGQEITAADEVIKTYISHRKLRINQVLDALSTDEWMSAENIIDNVYPGLEAILRKGALNNTHQALSYLLNVGKVIENDNSQWKKLDLKSKL